MVFRDDKVYEGATAKLLIKRMRWDSPLTAKQPLLAYTFGVAKRCWKIGRKVVLPYPWLLFLLMYSLTGFCDLSFEQYPDKPVFGKPFIDVKGTRNAIS
jgi:hypothetical protein